MAVAVRALAPSLGGITHQSWHVRSESSVNKANQSTIPVGQPNDLNRLRGNEIVRRIPDHRDMSSFPTGLKTMAPLIVLRDIATKQVLASAQRLRRSRRPQNAISLGNHYETIRVAMQASFRSLGVAA